jgi:glycosyltransferase involved in cell wall biosynthesis
MDQPPAANSVQGIKKDIDRTNGKKNGPVSVVIPAYNEAQAIQRQIEAIQMTLATSQIPYEIIVVDDGSTDQTAEAVMRLTGSDQPLRLLQHFTNRGYGASLKTGILAAQHDTIVIIDADGTYPADQVPALLEKLDAADMVVGARIGEDVHTPWLRRPAKWLLRSLAMRIAEKPIPDLNSGLRAFRRECALQYFSILSNQFSFTTTITLAYLADDYHVVYHPINYFQRTGRSKVVPWHFLDFTIIILRICLMFNPLKVFVPLALLFGILGGLKTVYDIAAAFARYPDIKGLLIEPVLSTSAVLLIFIALQLMMIGMMADGVIRRISQTNRPLVPSHGLHSVEISRPHSQTED